MPQSSTRLLERVTVNRLRRMQPPELRLTDHSDRPTLPRWLQRARAGELYGQGVTGLDLTSGTLGRDS